MYCLWKSELKKQNNRPVINFSTGFKIFIINHLLSNFKKK